MRIVSGFASVALGEMRVTLTERRAMQAFHLLRGDTCTAIARRFRRDRYNSTHFYRCPMHDTVVLPPSGIVRVAGSDDFSRPALMRQAP